jgi:hypothetical protein
MSVSHLAKCSLRHLEDATQDAYLEPILDENSKGHRKTLVRLSPARIAGVAYVISLCGFEHRKTEGKADGKTPDDGAAEPFRTHLAEVFHQRGEQLAELGARSGVRVPGTNVRCSENKNTGRYDTLLVLVGLPGNPTEQEARVIDPGSFYEPPGEKKSGATASRLLPISLLYFLISSPEGRVGRSSKARRNPLPNMAGFFKASPRPSSAKFIVANINPCFNPICVRIATPLFGY